MSDHHKQTEFLKRCLRYDESAGGQELERQISRIQRDERCVRRAVWLMAMVAALVVAGLGYGVISGDNFPDNLPRFVIKILCSFGLGSLISMLGFIGLGMVYRKKLNHQREECRQLVTRLLESRLGKPATTPVRDNPVGEGAASAVRVANEVNDSPIKVETPLCGAPPQTQIYE